MKYTGASFDILDPVAKGLSCSFLFDFRWKSNEGAVEGLIMDKEECRKVQRELRRKSQRYYSN